MVAIDQYCEVYALPRWIDQKTKDVRARIDENTLLSVLDTKKQIAQEMETKLSQLQDKSKTLIAERIVELQGKRASLKDHQKAQRDAFLGAQPERWLKETKDRQERFNRGLKGVLDWFTGKRRYTRKRNEEETQACETRDRAERDQLSFKHLDQMGRLRSRQERLRRFTETNSQAIESDVSQYTHVSLEEVGRFELGLTKKIEPQR